MCGKLLNLLWQFFYIIGQIFIALNGRKMKQILAIWSHWQCPSVYVRERERDYFVSKLNCVTDKWVWMAERKTNRGKQNTIRLLPELIFRVQFILCVPLFSASVSLILILSSFIKKWPNPGHFLFIFGLFKQTIQFLQQINVKKCSNIHLVYSAGIQTPNLLNMSRHS